MLIRILSFPFCINRSQFKYYIGKLTTTTGLLFQCLTMFDCGLECFFVSNLRCTLVYFYFKFSPHTINNNLQVKFAHTAQDSLTSFFICLYTQCWVFFDQL